jgi:hypothetical protein
VPSNRRNRYLDRLGRFGPDPDYKVAALEPVAVTKTKASVAPDLLAADFQDRIILVPVFRDLDVEPLGIF